jgi:hypothetical protein
MLGSIAVYFIVGSSQASVLRQVRHASRGLSYRANCIQGKAGQHVGNVRLDLYLRKANRLPQCCIGGSSVQLRLGLGGASWS